jgi:hypothetical protein
MFSGIGDLEWECTKKLGQHSTLLFTSVQKTANFACNLCKSGGEKGPMPFTKVVEQ